MTRLTGPMYAPDAYAGFWRRTLALVIDAVILLLASLVLIFVWSIMLAIAQTITGVDPTAQSPDRWFTAFLLLGPLTYLFGFRLTEGGTLGYRIVRIRYASMFSFRPTRTDLLNRAVVAIALLLIDHLWILTDPWKQALHDKFAGFYVIKCSARPIGTQPVVRRLINFMLLTFPIWEPASEPPSLPTATPPTAHPPT